MSEQLKQFAVAAFDRIAGPVLDEFGSEWQPTENLTKWIITDRQTGKPIGKSQMVAGDGIVYLTSLDETTQLRKNTKTKVAKKLGVK